ncbi:MAG: SPFH domain-containing protein [Candidatus Promineifilaceae bacterium]|nr:SPFH domain-containing protein [Candidatus Promineifilaceae bacterium]
MFEIAIGILLLVVIFVALAVAYASRVKKVGPNEVLVISGRGEGRRDAEAGHMKSNFRIVTGGRSFIWPVLERVDNLSLEIITIDVTTPDVPSIQGVPVTVDGVAQVKIGSDENSIRTAAIQFLSKSKDEIEHIAHETLAGHLRAILGTLTVEQLYRDREAFAQKVQEVSGDDMASMGLEIVSFVIKDISDEEGYLEALGRPRIAQVKRDAAIGEAEAARDATIESAKARQEGESAKFAAETKIAESRKNFEVQQAAYQAESNRKKAESDLAYTLQENITNQTVRAEEVQVEVVSKQKQIEVQSQEALRKEQELDATVRKPAEAERYQIQTLAEARQFQLQTEALGEAEAIRKRGEAEAEVLRTKGLAEADVLRQKGMAEAEATRKKADAWKEYTQAAILQQLLDKLPEVASAVAQPLAKTDRIVVISNGGENGSGTGTSKITQDITNIVAQVPATIEALTGLDLMAAIQDLTGLKPEEKNELRTEDSTEEPTAKAE